MLHKAGHRNCLSVTWSRKYVILGKMQIIDRVEAKKSMLDAYPELRGMYDENDDNTQVLYFKDAVATFSSFAAPEEVVKF